MLPIRKMEGYFLIQVRYVNQLDYPDGWRRLPEIGLGVTVGM